MSDKPKIHAFCAAGCKWETVHKADFLASAPLIRLGYEEETEIDIALGTKRVTLVNWSDIPENHTPTLEEQFGTYIIHDGSSAESENPTWGIAVKLSVDMGSEVNDQLVVTLPTRKQFENDIKFRICGITHPTIDGVTIVYEVDGVRHTFSSSAPDILISDSNTIRVYVQIPTESGGYVNKINDGATVIVGGASVVAGALAYAASVDAITALCAEKETDYPFVWIGRDNTIFDDKLHLKQGDIYSVALWDESYTVSKLVEYIDESRLLPEVSEADAGKILAVNAEGKIVPVTVDTWSGGSY